jgi:hypothetical protein
LAAGFAADVVAGFAAVVVAGFAVVCAIPMPVTPARNNTANRNLFRRTFIFEASWCLRA